MVEIITITNIKIFDGKVISRVEFDNICEALKLSRFEHTIKYKEGGKYYLGKVI